MVRWRWRLCDLAHPRKVASGGNAGFFRKRPREYLGEELGGGSGRESAGREENTPDGWTGRGSGDHPSLAVMPLGEPL